MPSAAPLLLLGGAGLLYLALRPKKASAAEAVPAAAEAQPAASWSPQVRSVVSQSIAALPTLGPAQARQMAAQLAQQGNTVAAWVLDTAGASYGQYAAPQWPASVSSLDPAAVTAASAVGGGLGAVLLAVAYALQTGQIPTSALPPPYPPGAQGAPPGMAPGAAPGGVPGAPPGLPPMPGLPPGVPPAMPGLPPGAAPAGGPGVPPGVPAVPGLPGVPPAGPPAVPGDPLSALPEPQQTLARQILAGGSADSIDAAANAAEALGYHDVAVYLHGKAAELRGHGAAQEPETGPAYYTIKSGDIPSLMAAKLSRDPAVIKSLMADMMHDNPELSWQADHIHWNGWNVGHRVKVPKSWTDLGFTGDPVVQGGLTLRKS